MQKIKMLNFKRYQKMNQLLLIIQLKRSQFRELFGNCQQTSNRRVGLSLCKQFYQMSNDFHLFLQNIDQQVNTQSQKLIQLQIQLNDFFKRREHRQQKLKVHWLENLEQGLGQINADKIRFIQQIIRFKEERTVSQTKIVMPNLSRLNGVGILVSLLIWGLLVECRQEDCVTSDDLRKRICSYKEERHSYEFVSCDETKCEAQLDSSSCLQTKHYYNLSECLQNICGFSEGQGDFETCRATFVHKDYVLLIVLSSVSGSIFLIMICALIIKCRKNKKNEAQSRPQQRVVNSSNTNNSLQGNQMENPDNLNPTSQKNTKQLQSNNLVLVLPKPNDHKKQISFQKFKIFMTEDDFDQGYIPQHSNQQKCCICLSSEELNCQTACNHFYHYICLIEWKKKSEFCPCCRSKNFLPAKLFCITCGKIRDIFCVKKLVYAGKSKVGIEFFNQLQECKQCRINKLSQITNFNFF